MFADLEAFVAAHRPCGDFDAVVGEPSADGYRLEVTCGCGATFARWITAEIAREDLVYSRLLASEN